MVQHSSALPAVERFPGNLANVQAFTRDSQAIRKRPPDPAASFLPLANLFEKNNSPAHEPVGMRHPLRKSRAIAMAAAGARRGPRRDGAE